MLVDLLAGGDSSKYSSPAGVPPSSTEGGSPVDIMSIPEYSEPPLSNAVKTPSLHSVSGATLSEGDACGKTPSEIWALEYNSSKRRAFRFEEESKFTRWAENEIGIIDSLHAVRSNALERIAKYSAALGSKKNMELAAALKVHCCAQSVIWLSTMKSR